MMKTYSKVFAALILLGCAACARTSPEGGSYSTTDARGFTISVPAMQPSVRQGEVGTVVVTLNREENFTDDVRLKIKSEEGINVEPDSIVIHSGDKPEVQILLAAADDAALAVHRVDVEGIPRNGQPTYVSFDVKVEPR